MMILIEMDCRLIHMLQSLNGCSKTGACLFQIIPGFRDQSPIRKLFLFSQFSRIDPVIQKDSASFYNGFLVN